MFIGQIEMKIVFPTERMELCQHNLNYIKIKVWAVTAQMFSHLLLTKGTSEFLLLLASVLHIFAMIIILTYKD